MHEVLILGVGILVGTLVTGISGYLGGHLVLRTYLELTQTHLELPNTVEDNTNTTTTQPDGYDWQEYDQYIAAPIDEDGNEPEA